MRIVAKLWWFFLEGVSTTNSSGDWDDELKKRRKSISGEQWTAERAPRNSGSQVVVTRWWYWFCWWWYMWCGFWWSWWCWIWCRWWWGERRRNSEARGELTATAGRRVVVTCARTVGPSRPNGQHQDLSVQSFFSSWFYLFSVNVAIRQNLSIFLSSDFTNGQDCREGHMVKCQEWLVVSVCLMMQYWWWHLWLVRVFPSHPKFCAFVNGIVQGDNLFSKLVFTPSYPGEFSILPMNSEM